MKKILATLSMVCFVAFMSSAQTTPSSTSTTKETVKTSTTTSTDASASTTKKTCAKGSCKKGGKNCTKAGADSKTPKASTTGGSAN